MPKTITLQSRARLTDDNRVFPVSAAGLKEMSTKARVGSVNILIDATDMDDDAKVNFVAMWQKCQSHLKFIFGTENLRYTARTQVWRKYFRHKVDNEHGSNASITQFLTNFLTGAHLDNLSITERDFVFIGRFPSTVVLAAAVGRIINMMNWCKQHTPTIKLLSEANFTWDTFQKISVNGEQPVVRRRK
jgi:hypothetical protein